MKTLLAFPVTSTRLCEVADALSQHKHESMPLKRLPVEIRLMTYASCKILQTRWDERLLVLLITAKEDPQLYGEVLDSYLRLNSAFILQSSGIALPPSQSLEERRIIAVRQLQLIWSFGYGQVILHRAKILLNMCSSMSKIPPVRKPCTNVSTFMLHLHRVSCTSFAKQYNGIRALLISPRPRRLEISPYSKDSSSMRRYWEYLPACANAIIHSLPGTLHKGQSRSRVEYIVSFLSHVLRTEAILDGESGTSGPCMCLWRIEEEVLDARRQIIPEALGQCSLQGNGEVASATTSKPQGDHTLFCHDLTILIQ